MIGCGFLEVFPVKCENYGKIGCEIVGWKNKFSGMVIEESSGGFCISYGGFFNGAHCPIPTQSDPIPTQSDPIPTQSDPIPTQSDLIPTQSDPIPTHSKMIFHLGDYCILWGIFT